MKKHSENSLPKVLFVHNMIFLFFFFITPKFYLFDEFGLRGEDILLPFTFLLFLAVLPKLKELDFPKLHRAIIAYFAYVIVQGLILSSLTGALKYFAVVTMKQLQYFMVFYLLLYTFKFTELKKITMKFISILVGANLAWALFQIVTGRQAFYMWRAGRPRIAYGIGAVGETFPHQAAAVFLFCFLFSYFHRTVRSRKLFMALSSAAVFMTMSRITIAAWVICALYIVLTNKRLKAVFKKPAAAFILAVMVIISGYTADRILSSYDKGSYESLKSRFSRKNLSRGVEKRKDHLQMHLFNEHYLAHAPLNSATGMGRGYANTAIDSWRMAGDSGYLRDFVEIGLFGLFLHLLIYIRAGQYAGFKRYFVVFLPYLILSITYEAFLMSKSGLIILILTAILLDKENNNKKGLSRCPANSG